MRFRFLAPFLLALSACSPAQLLTLGVPRDSYTIREDVAYEAGDRHQSDIYQPAHPAPGHPVVVFFYGGEWIYGNRQEYRFVAEPLAEAGVTVVVPDYRLSPQVTFPAFIQDGAAATAWTKQHIAEYGGNPKNLFVMGHSAGAYIAAMLALNPAYLKDAGLSRGDLSGAIGISGPYNFLPITWPELKPIFDVVPDPWMTQPITFADGKNPPMLLMAGLSDDTVDPQKNTDGLFREIEDNGGPASERLDADVGHIGMVTAFSPLLQDKAPVLADTLTFIQANVKTE